MNAKMALAAPSTVLVQKFADIAVEQGKAALLGETAKFNRLYDHAKAIEDELRSRPGDERWLLETIFDHPDIYVRYTAATAALAVRREAAIAVLQKIADSHDYPAAAEARGTLNWVADGRFVPE